MKKSLEQQELEIAEKRRQFEDDRAFWEMQNKNFGSDPA